MAKLATYPIIIFYMSSAMYQNMSCMILSMIFLTYNLMVRPHRSTLTFTLVIVVELYLMLLFAINIAISLGDVSLRADMSVLIMVLMFITLLIIFIIILLSVIKAIKGYKKALDEGEKRYHRSSAHSVPHVD